MTDIGFLKAQSDNLPRIDSFMLTSFFVDNPDFISAEIKGVKAFRSGRENYGDNAVGYVQVKREGNICTVKGKITPEHSVRKKAYTVVLICNEALEIVNSVQCEDCAAQLGGCKHAVAFLTWLHRRSEEPSVTSVTCYWKKSKLSSVGTSLKFVKCKDLGKSSRPVLAATDGSFLKSVVDHGLKIGNNKTQIMKYFTEVSDSEKLSIHYLINEFCKAKPEVLASNFIKYCQENMPENSCKNAYKATMNQATCPLWFELRFARVTASKAYEAAHCKKMDGTLVETILGAMRIKDTAAMKRGRLLETRVIKEVEKKIGQKIKTCGFITNPEFPIFGASPDGVCDEFIIEVKCPMSSKALNKYINRDEITVKYNSQVQLQMHFAEKKKALFCVALEDFERSNDIKIITVHYDERFCKELLDKC